MEPIKVVEIVLQSPNAPIENTQGVVIYRPRDMVIWSEDIDPKSSHHGQPGNPIHQGLDHQHSSPLLQRSRVSTTIDDNTTPGVAGSYRPAAVDLGLEQVLLKIRLLPRPPQALIASGFKNLQIIGELDDRQVASGSYTPAKEYCDVLLEAKQAGTPWGYAGNLTWFLVCANRGRTKLNTTRIEVYGLSSSLPRFFKNYGTPVKLLRYIVLPAPRDGYRAWVATTCMTDFFFRYNTYGGPSRFVTSKHGGTFKLRFWLDTMFTRSMVNCHDQAGIVQLCLSFQFGSPPNIWGYMSRFGYLNRTQLVGVGECNNPIHRDQLARRCVEEYDSCRTSFGSHSIIILEEKVIDSTCGPYAGTETTKQYIDSAIDSNVSTEEIASSIQRGSGITMLGNGLSTLDAASQSSKPPPSSEPPAKHYSNADLTALMNVLKRHFTEDYIQLKHQSITIGPNGSETNYVFSFNDVTLTLSLSICTSYETAIDVMNQHLSTYTVRPAPEGYKNGRIGFESDTVCVWVRGDAFFVLQAECPTPVMKRIEEVIDRYIEEFDVEAEDAYKPRIISDPDIISAPNIISAPSLPSPVGVGSEFKVTLRVEDAGEIEVGFEAGNVLLLSKKRPTGDSRIDFNFYALEPADETISLYIAHKLCRRVICCPVQVSVQQLGTGGTATAPVLSTGPA
ncbi:hypothetical protein F5Y19DRAFT_215777 [Xylariaceae sp. FL1651]|nr:hypothetical protein F5Y19DRAFT_215777 [Xylariaceae sp. FL1651]